MTPSPFRASRLLAPVLLALPLVTGCAVRAGAARDPAGAGAGAEAAPGDQALDVLAREAVSEDRAVAGRAIARLRASGPAGLDALFDAHPAAIARLGLPSGPA